MADEWPWWTRDSAISSPTSMDWRKTSATLGVDDRAARVVDTVWSAFSSPTSKATLELLIATLLGRSHAAKRHLASTAARLAGVATLFADDISTEDAARVGNLIWSTIRGLVTLQMLWPDPVDTARDRQMLVDVLTAYLRGARG